MLQRRARVVLQPVGTNAGEQLVQHDAERIDVRRRGERLPADLLGRCVAGREQPAGHLRELGFLRSFLGQELADAEVQQHDAPFGRHENVRRLQVAVNDQLRVRELHCFHHLHEQAQPLANAEQSLVAAVDQLRAGDVLHREIGLAGLR